MKSNIYQLTAFHLRALLYKNFKKHFEDSQDYQQWRFHRRASSQAQFEAYLKLKQCQTWETIQNLSEGSAKPGRLDLAALRLRAVTYRHLKGLLKKTRGYKQWRNSRSESKAIQVAAHLRSRMIDRALLDSKILRGTANEAKQIQFPIQDKPTVSVLIPVYNKIEYTLTCLQSIQMNRPQAAFEIIVIDDCSSDATPQLLAQVQGLRIIRNDLNLGFLRNCNKAAREARGDYLLLLNNDTEVRQGWMDAMLQTFAAFPDAGLVGSKLIFPYGMLQEAGGIIWKDASGCNYGRDAYPDRPEFCFMRDTDYCSGASIMIPRQLFLAVGGFDERFSPAYYEDTDLAFTVRKLGKRVIYQPFSQVIHHEGITSGTDLMQGVKSYQVRNQAVFLDKWRDTLAQHGTPNQQILCARERRVAKRALIIDVTTPLPDQDSGSMDAFYEIRVVQSLGYKVTFLADDLRNAGPYTEALQKIGVECWYRPYLNSIKAHLESSGSLYDLVIVKRAHYAAKYIDDVRRCCSNAKVIFNTVDLHFLREERQAALEGSELLTARARQTKELEYRVMKRCHATITISETERDIVLQEHPELNVAAIPYIRDVAEHCPPYASRRDVVFIGGFLHTPNVDALLYFVEEVWPLARKTLPDVNLRIVGSNATEEIKQLATRPGIVFVGYVPNLDTVFNHCRLSVAPLRFGAGIKGKIGTSLSYGVPCIATPLAAEGMHLTDQQEVLIAATPADFAAAVIKAYSDETLWNRLSGNGLAHVRARYSFEQGAERFRALLESVENKSELTA